VGSRAGGRTCPSKSSSPSRARPPATGSAGRDRPQLAEDRPSTASSIRLMSTPACRVERPGVSVAVVRPEDVIREPAPAALAPRLKRRDDMPPPSTVERNLEARTGRDARAGCSSARRGTTWRLVGLFFVKTLTRPPPSYGFVGAGSPVSTSGRSPSSSWGRARASPSADAAADPEHHARRVGTTGRGTT